VIGLVALAAAATPAAAPAAPPVSAFATFQKVCIAPRAAPAAVAAAAQAAGFSEPPADGKAKVIADLATAGIDNPDVRFLPVGEKAVQLLIFGRKQAPDGDPFPVAARLNLCILVAPSDPAAETALAAWAAVPADQTVADAVAFEFVGDPHRPIKGLSAETAGAAARKGELQVAGVQKQTGVTVLSYGRNEASVR
jgi:hypothetical protein